MIRIEHLTRRFHDIVAVDDVSLDVAAGEVVGFLGPNGAGKTTTLRILTGFLPATSGRAVVAGHDVASESLAVRRRVGYCPENVPLPLEARVDEYLEYRGRLKGLDRTRLKTRRAAVIEQCGLQPMGRRILGQLSRGYRQRVGLADALLADPEVLILDEPTGGLDPGQRQEVIGMVQRLHGQRTVLLSSHVLAEVEHLCSRVAIIKGGRIVADGTKEQLEATVGRRGEVRLGAGRPGEALAGWLRGRGLTVTDARPDGTCTVRLPRHDDIAPLVAAAVQAGLAIEHCEPLTRSLHEIFLDLTSAGSPPATSAGAAP